VADAAEENRNIPVQLMFANVGRSSGKSCNTSMPNLSALQISNRHWQVSAGKSTTSAEQTGTHWQEFHLDGGEPIWLFSAHVDGRVKDDDHKLVRVFFASDRLLTDVTYLPRLRSSNWRSQKGPLLPSLRSPRDRLSCLFWHFERGRSSKNATLARVKREHVKSLRLFAGRKPKRIEHSKAVGEVRGFCPPLATLKMSMTI